MPQFDAEPAPKPAPQLESRSHLVTRDWTSERLHRHDEPSASRSADTDSHEFEFPKEIRPRGEIARHEVNTGTENPGVGGSNPSLSTISYTYGPLHDPGVASWREKVTDSFGGSDGNGIRTRVSALRG